MSGIAHNVHILARWRDAFMRSDRARFGVCLAGILLLLAAATAFVFKRHLVADQNFIIVLLMALPLAWGLFSMSARNLEFSMLVMSLFFSFGYRALKPTLNPSFMWIIAVPALALYYLFMTREGGHRLVLKTRMDKLVLAFMVYGVVMTGVGVVSGGGASAVLKTFTHAYLPGILYFISRQYSADSEVRAKKILNLAWIISLVIIVDGLGEFYLLQIERALDVIPWTAANIRASMAELPPNALRLDPFLPLRNISFLASNKVLSMMVSALGCLTVGFLLSSRESKGDCPRSLWQRSNLVNGIFFGCFFTCSILLSSYASTVTFLVTGLILVAHIKTGKLRVYFLLSLFGVACYVLLYDYFVMFYQYKVVSAAVSDGRSAVEHTFSLGALFKEYLGSPFTFLFGRGVLGEDAIRGGSNSELRLLAYPMYYGIGWGVITVLLAVTILKYCRELVFIRGGRDPVNAIGLALMGFFLIYFFDVHYPSFDRHGPFELFFVMAGLLSSLHEIHHANAQV